MLINALGDPPTGLRSIRATRFSSRAFRIAFQGFGERRRLPESRPSRGVELPLQPFVLIPQPIAFTLDLTNLVPRALELRSQSVNLLTDRLDLFGAIVRRGHAPVMPELAPRYKTR
jgi:hypothetical protein